MKVQGQLLERYIACACSMAAIFSTAERGCNYGET